MKIDFKKIAGIEGKKDYIEKAKHKLINRSPTPAEIMRIEDLENQIEFVKKEIKIHIENENHRMIGHKKEELKELEKKLG